MEAAGRSGDYYYNIFATLSLWIGHHRNGFSHCGIGDGLRSFPIFIER